MNVHWKSGLAGYHPPPTIQKQRSPDLIGRFGLLGIALAGFAIVSIGTYIELNKTYPVCFANFYLSACVR